MNIEPKQYNELMPFTIHQKLGSNCIRPQRSTTNEKYETIVRAKLFLLCSIRHHYSRSLIDCYCEP